MTCQSCGSGLPLLNGKTCYACDSKDNTFLDGYLFRPRMSFGDFLIQVELDRLDYEKMMKEEGEESNGE